jgi:purine catabolism regulator
VVLAVASATPAVAETTSGRLRTRLPDAVVGQRRGHSIWLMERAPLGSLLADCAGDADVAFGLGTGSDDLALERAAQEAALAAELGLRLGLGQGRPRVFQYAEVYTYAAALAEAPALSRSHTALLGPLLGRPALLETLRQYFATGRSVSRTAAAVHLHRQSVVYRMRQVATLLDVSLDDAEAMFRLEAAVRTLPAA